MRKHFGLGVRARGNTTRPRYLNLADTCVSKVMCSYTSHACGWLHTLRRSRESFEDHCPSMCAGGFKGELYIFKVPKANTGARYFWSLPWVLEETWGAQQNAKFTCTRYPSFLRHIQDLFDLGRDSEPHLRRSAKSKDMQRHKRGEDNSGASCCTC